jgi:hypothetical protein
VILKKIISGGQAGVDRGALEAALELGLEHGGFVPRGRRAEDGRVPERFQLIETPSDQYPPRTAMNVKLGDGTLLLFHGKAALAKSRGTKLTLQMLVDQEKPWWACDPRLEGHAERAAVWIASHHIEVLNVAGPRESKCPGIQEEARRFVRMVFERLS